VTAAQRNSTAADKCSEAEPHRGQALILSRNRALPMGISARRL
jgi:hypothetical protein